MKNDTQDRSGIIESSAASTGSSGSWHAVFAQLGGNARSVDGAGVPAVYREPVRSGSTALIIADVDLCHRSFRAGMASLGYCSVTVRQPLEAIVCLQDDAMTIGAVLAPAYDPRFNTLQFFAFMRAEFPLVRRIGYAKHASKHADALEAGLLDVVLICPTPRPELAEALQPASELLPGATLSSVPLQDDRRSDKQLFQAWKGTDRRPFRELDRRYRPRIHQLALSMRFSDEDAEEIAQETLLGLFLRGGALPGHTAPDNLICGLTATSVLARLRGERRQTRLRSALTHQAVTERTGRERGGQPDQRLRATRTNAVVRKLPDWRWRAFRLRAAEGQKAVTSA